MSKIKVRFVSGFLALALILSMSACGNKNAGDKKDSTNTKAATSQDKKEDKKSNAKTGDKKDEKKATEEKKDAKVSLKDWEGTWNSITAYFDKDEYKDAFEKLGKKDNKTADEAKKELTKKRKANFNGLVISGDTISFLDNFASENGKEMAKLKYTYVESHKVKHGNHELAWHVFETKDSQEYKYLLMMPIHGEEELTHFHMRYGKDVKELLAMEDWYPTFIKPTSTVEQISEEIAE